MTAPAKVNLFLRLTGKEANGYHALQSAVTFLDAGDILEFSPHDSLMIDIDGPFAGQLDAPQNNLIYKAAKLLAEEYKTEVGAKIRLIKNLPVAAGLGGGSSDAAATLLGLIKLLRLREDDRKLQSIAVRLGADVPACLARRTVWIEGTGATVTLLPPLPDMYFVLVNPGVPVLTADVFRKFSGSKFSTPLKPGARRKSFLEWIADLKMYSNDLTESAVALTPDIRQVLADIAQTKNCALARMSGSGATCFGIYENRAAADLAAKMLQEKHPDWWVTAAGLLK